jgi:hypothetical protein
VFGSRPDVYELIGYCDVRLGRPDLAERMLSAAVQREPRSWELYYGLALIRGAAGRDPRPSCARRSSAIRARRSSRRGAADGGGQAAGLATRGARLATDHPSVANARER